MSTDLTDAINGTPTPEPAPEEQPTIDPTPEVEAEAVTETVAEPTVEPEKAAEPEPRMVPLAAVQEERQKRQELERRLVSLEQSVPKPEPAPVPDVYDDPEGYAQYVQREAAQTAETTRLNMAEEMSRLHFGDEVVDKALEAFDAHKGTALHQQMLSARNPFKAVVDWHKQQTVMSEIGDPDAWRTAETARIRAEIEAEMAVKQVQGIPPAPSLAAQSNVGDRKGPEWGGPTPLEKILGG